MIGLDVDFGLRQLTRSLSLSQVVLRGAMAVATVICMVATAQASPNGVGVFWWVLVVLAGLWAVVSPDTAGPWALLAALALCWWASVDDPMSVWLLVTALAAVTIHACAALACAGPPSVSFGAQTLTRWGIAFGAVASATVLLWFVLLSIEDADTQASTLRLALALGVVALFAWWIRRLTLDDSNE